MNWRRLLSIFLKLLVDDLGDLRVWLRAVEEPPVYEQGRCATDTSLHSVEDIFLYGVRVLCRIQAGIKRRRIELQVYRLQLQIFDTKTFVVLEHRIMEFPELLLIRGAERRLRRFLRVRM